MPSAPYGSSMPAKTAIVTGSSGLIGSEVVTFLDDRGWTVQGVDNNMRRDFFGEHGDTTWNLERLRRETRWFEHNELDVRDRDAMIELELVELETRWDYGDPRYADGIDESMRIDATMHSVFGASKVAADVMVQEYGRYFGMPTVCFRGGCLTGPNHSSAELHGFLAYVARAIREGLTYRIYGYKGKQVRDNIHSYDVCTAIMAFAERPRTAAVYNLGGGRANSVSMLEAIERLADLSPRGLRRGRGRRPRSTARPSESPRRRRGARAPAPRTACRRRSGRRA